MQKVLANVVLGVLSVLMFNVHAYEIDDVVRIVNTHNQYSLRHIDGTIQEIHLNPGTSKADVDSTRFYLRSGLSGTCYSFESVDHPGFYIRHQFDHLRMHKRVASRQFSEEATFCLKNDHSLRPYHSAYYQWYTNSSHEVHLSRVNDSNSANRHRSPRDLRALKACSKGDTAQFAGLTGKLALNKACVALLGEHASVKEAGRNTYSCTDASKTIVPISYMPCLNEASQFMLEAGWQDYRTLAAMNDLQARRALLGHITQRRDQLPEDLSAESTQQLIALARQLQQAAAQFRASYRIGVVRDLQACWNGASGEFNGLQGRAGLSNACKTQFGSRAMLQHSGHLGYTCKLPNGRRRSVSYNNCLSETSQFMLESGWLHYDTIDQFNADDDITTLKIEISKRSDNSIETLNRQPPAIIRAYARHLKAVEPYRYGWSATPDQDSQNCALINSDGSLSADSCLDSGERHYACKNTITDTWKITNTAGRWRGGQYQCQKEFGKSYRFSFPNGERAFNSLSSVPGFKGDIWVNLTRRSSELRWVSWSNSR